MLSVARACVRPRQNPITLQIFRFIQTHHQQHVNSPLSSDSEASKIDNELPYQSSSEFITETLNGSHRFTIRNYSLLSKLSHTKKVSSGYFVIGGQTWKIVFEPKLTAVHGQDCTVSFLKLLTGQLPSCAMCEMKLLDQSGNGNHSVISPSNQACYDKVPYIFKSFADTLKFQIRSTDLENPDYLMDDCIQIHCTITVLSTRTVNLDKNSPSTVETEPKPPSLMQRFADYLSGFWFL